MKAFFNNLDIDEKIGIGSAITLVVGFLLLIFGQL